VDKGFVVLRFVGLYALYMTLFYAIFTYQSYVDLQLLYTTQLNSIVTPLINVIGIEAIASGINIVLPSATFKVIFGCNGLEAILIFLAGVLAYKATLSYKGEWVLKGIVIISLLNLIRIVILAYTIEYHRSYFDFMHDYITQDVMIFISIILFFIYIQNAKGVSYAK
jgi:exosortase/archaeosortase family protein